jgi:hypothetical protein
MSNIFQNTDVVLVNTKTRSGTITLPATSQIVGRTITVKDSGGACSLSTCYICTLGADVFDDGTNQKALTTSFGFLKMTAQLGKWYTLNTTIANTLNVSTLRTDVLNTNQVSTNVLTASSITLSTSGNSLYQPSTSNLYWGPYLLGGGTHIAPSQLFFYQASPVGGKGSLLFPGTTGGNITTPNFSGIQFGTGDFTVEFFTYQTGSISFPRVFSMGAYPSATFALSIEGGSFYFWFNGGHSFGSVNLFNAWNHVAITRSSSQTMAFINGTQLGTTFSNGYNHTDSGNALRIGGENSVNTGFSGYITNFRLIKGVSLYNANFTKPTSQFSAVSGTQVLLLTQTSADYLTDSSSNANTFTNNGGVTWVSKSPF